MPPSVLEKAAIVFNIAWTKFLSVWFVSKFHWYVDLNSNSSLSPFSIIESIDTIASTDPSFDNDVKKLFSCSDKIFLLSAKKFS